MLERERQHSHQLEQRLQQVEADALEVSCVLVGKEKTEKTTPSGLNSMISIVPGCPGAFWLQHTSSPA